VAGEGSFIWELISDVWDEYEQRDQIQSLWEGYLQVGSDLLLQLIQANLSKSIIDIPVFRRYRWKHYVLDTTKVPSSYTSSNLFAYDVGDVDVLNIPTLRDLVRDADGTDYIQITNSSTGIFQNGNQICDYVTLFPAEVRVGDYVRVLSGTDLEVKDTDVRFQVLRTDTPNCLTLDAFELADASALTYIIERSPQLSLIEGVHYTVDRGTLNFSPTPVLTADNAETAFRAVETLEWTGNFVRDDPRLIADGGNGVTSGTADIVLGSPLLTDSSALFLTGPVAERPVQGDYVVLRPSGVQPSQVLTTQQVFKVSSVLSDTQLTFDGRATTTTEQVTYDILKPSAEDFDLVSSENGIDGFTLGYAFRTVAAAAPSGITGSFVAADQFQEVGRDFAGLIGKKIRVLSNTGVDPSELAEFTITALVGAGPSYDTVQLDRSITAGTPTAADAVYVVGDVVAIDSVDTRVPTGTLFSDAFKFQNEDSNTSSVTDGAVYFNKDLVPAAGPLIKVLRDRIESTNTRESIVNQLWAEETIADQQALYENFGFPIQVQQENSQEYKNVLQGLWYAYWNGPSVDNIVRGLNLVFDLPYAPQDGVISDITLPDPAILVGTVASQSNAPPFTFDTSAGNPAGDSRFLAFSVDNQPPVLVVFPNTVDTPASGAGSVIEAINTAVGAPVASLSPDGRVVLTALTSVKIDTVIGNPGLGFEPGNEDFGTFNVTLVFDDGTSELLEFGTQFPLIVDVGDAVEQFQPLTSAVGVFDYINLPEWWKIFGIAQIFSGLEAFSDEDREILNDIAKDFTFAVRVVADAFTRLGSVDRSIIRFFLEQIKPTISDYLFIVAETFYDLISVTDDRSLLGYSPSPSAEFVAQHSGQAPHIFLEIGLQFTRTIDWNFANYYDLSPAERAALESGYHLAQYDDFRLTTEEITVVSPLEATVIQGVGPVSYQPAVLNGSVTTDFFDTSTSLSILWNGLATPVLNFSGPLLLNSDVIQEINTWFDAFVSPGDRLATLNPDGSLRLTVDRVSGAAPELTVLVANPGLGLAATTVFGVAGTGVSQTIQSS
jgi:hypothetical protein